MAWNADQYLRFADLRLRPGLELLARVPADEPALVIDLGCGAGALTHALRARYPHAHITAIDQSAEMLARARRGGGDAPPAAKTIDWRQQDIAAFTSDAPIDLLYSNAALHWLPDHAVLLPRLCALLRPGGWLAIQMPLSHDLPSHRLLRETLAQVGAAQLAAASAPVHPPESYAEWLVPLCPVLDIWSTEYLQVLAGEDAVLEWVRGTALVPVLAALAPPAATEFLERYRKRLRAAYPRRADGATVYPFRRLFIVAQRGEP